MQERKISSLLETFKKNMIPHIFFIHRFVLFHNFIIMAMALCFAYI